MKEIRLHGRGGQGTVMASQILVSAFAIEGKYGAAIPFFGFERRGAPGGLRGGRGGGNARRT